MTNLEGRWECGSEFHLPEFRDGGNPNLPPRSSQYASGRDAMRSLFSHGLSQLGWKVLWVPTYYCQTVIRDVKADGLEIRSYPDSVYDNSEQPIRIESDEPGAILLLNPFGMRTNMRQLSSSQQLYTVEDHTHDPWSWSSVNSKANFALASLRKTVPIPDGGLLWSPIGCPLPPTPSATPHRSAASLLKLKGMTLKRLYLEGYFNDKETLRSLLVAGEANIADSNISGMPSHTRSLLDAFPAEAWRARRKQNFYHLAHQLEDERSLAIFHPTSEENVPFSFLVRVSTPALRDELRTHLIQRRIFPAILWSLEEPQVSGIRNEDLELSRQMLSIHCDGRYSLADMDKVADAILSANDY